MEEKKQLIEILGKWASLAILLGGMIYGSYTIWDKQMQQSHEKIMLLIEKTRCTNEQKESGFD